MLALAVNWSASASVVVVVIGIEASGIVVSVDVRAWLNALVESSMLVALASSGVSSPAIVI